MDKVFVVLMDSWNGMYYEDSHERTNYFLGVFKTIEAAKTFVDNEVKIGRWIDDTIKEVTYFDLIKEDSHNQYYYGKEARECYEIVEEDVI